MDARRNPSNLFEYSLVASRVKRGGSCSIEKFGPWFHLGCESCQVQ
jgi:hypothetical protein